MHLERMNGHMRMRQGTSFPKNGLRDLLFVKRRQRRDNITERQVGLLGSTGLLCLIAVWDHSINIITTDDYA